MKPDYRFATLVELVTDRIFANNFDAAAHRNDRSVARRSYLEIV
jgi:hypothetical protein